MPLCSSYLHPFPPSLSLSLKKVSAFFCLFSLSNKSCRGEGTDPQTLSTQAMADDWDLQAVVRGCTATSAASTTTTTTTTTSLDTQFTPLGCELQQVGSSAQSSYLFSFPEQPFEERTAIGGLHELYKPFFPKSQPVINYFSPPISSSSSVTTAAIISNQQPQIKQQQQPKQLSNSVGSVTSATSSHTPRSKRRKNQQKKVCQVPAEALSSDVWAWRKYGQKPIKGSPYPRGYYRCSSSKGCLARKQVERNRSDPGMFIVTYTAEHNHPAPTHRNSLAGSTRQKTTSTTTQVVSAGESNNLSPAKPTCSSPATSVDEELLAAQSANTESKEERDIMEDDEDDEFGGFSDMAVSDDFFVGLEELSAPATMGDSFADPFPASFGFPWLVNNAATAAGGI